MNWIDNFKLAWRGLKLIAFPAILFLTAAACLGTTAFKKYNAMHREQQKSCNLIVSSSKMDSSDASKIRSITGVKNTTLIYEINTSISLSGYQAELTLKGIESSFLSEDFSIGGIFPDQTVMPYIIINEAAQKTFFDTDTNTITDEAIQNLDWMNAMVILRMGEKEIIAKICGILKNQEETSTPEAYISIPSAKSLLQESGQTPEATTLWIQIENAGLQGKLQNQLQLMGFTAENADTGLIQKWNQTQLEIKYLLLAALISLSAFLLLLREKIRIIRFLAKAFKTTAFFSESCKY